MRECNKCGMVKGINAFAKNATCKDGYRRQCKECDRTPKKDKQYLTHLSHLD